MKIMSRKCEALTVLQNIMMNENSLKMSTLDINIVR